MNLKQITEFREIMRTGSVSQAARNLNRSQPGLSASLRALEADLDMPLFTRRGKRLHPVPEAHYLYAEADEIIQRLQTARQNMRSLRNLDSGVLRIVAMPGPSAFILPSLISKFVEDKPDVEITLITRSSPQVYQMVATQAYDLGIADKMNDAEVDTSLLVTQTIASECVCALPANDPLVSKSEITAQDLDGQPLGVLHPGHVTYINTKAAFESCGATFTPRIHTQYFLPLFEFVEASQVYAIVDPLSAASYQHYRPEHQGIVFRPFRPNVVKSMVCLQPGHRSQSALARAFASHWLEEAERLSTRFESNAGNIV